MNLDSNTSHLIQTLLIRAGIYGQPDAVTLLGDSTSLVWRITVKDRHYVVRQRSDHDRQMIDKEVYLTALLKEQQVPTSEVLATIADENRTATLSTYIDGVRLDAVLSTLSQHEKAQVWHSVGEYFRLAHTIEMPTAGEIIGDQIEPFTGGWTHFVLEDLETDIAWLMQKLAMPHPNIAQVDRVIATAKSILSETPICLLHNDALPQNMLVAPGEQGWQCVAWLDWEFARAGDPIWDVATLDFRPAQLVPPHFYEGYGYHRNEQQASIYDLLMAVWRTRVELEHGALWDWPPQTERIKYLIHLSKHIERLANL
ncbi:MAG: aminoglycoside phosphotransferase family protein [Chloroflexota bacterium]